MPVLRAPAEGDRRGLRIRVLHSELALVRAMWFHQGRGLRRARSVRRVLLLDPALRRSRRRAGWQRPAAACGIACGVSRVSPNHIIVGSEQRPCVERKDAEVGRGP